MLTFRETTNFSTAAGGCIEYHRGLEALLASFPVLPLIRFVAFSKPLNTTMSQFQLQNEGSNNLFASQVDCEA